MADEEQDDAEVAAMAVAFDALRALDYHAQIRAHRWLGEKLDAHRRRRSHVGPGDRVRHGDSGWAGVVEAVEPDTTGMAGSQGALVTVRPDRPERDYEPTTEWRPVTVTADELVLIDAGGAS